MNCRSCGSSNLKEILWLGYMPLANAFLRREELNRKERKYPLDLVICRDCSLVQITETVPAEILFKEYIYFSSYSDTMLLHSRKLVEKLLKLVSKDGFVVEIASNDGYLLQYFKPYNIPVLGIEPALNVAKVAKQKGIPTLCKFFNSRVATQLKEKGKEADLVIGLNVLAHVSQLNSFVEGIRILLKPRGTAVFEFPYVRDMIDNNEFDTIYHEHLCYYSLTSVKNLFDSHRLVIEDVERIPIHGGSLRIYVKHSGNPTPSVEALLQEERELGVDKPAFYEAFADRVSKLRKQILFEIEKLKRQGKKIVGYGAAAKGNVLLNYFGLGKYIDYIVDRSPHKQNLYTPGTHIPVYSTEKLLEDQPDFVLLLAWNFADEILRQQSDYRKRGGKFIIPIPEVRVV